LLPDFPIHSNTLNYWPFNKPDNITVSVTVWWADGRPLLSVV